MFFELQVTKISIIYLNFVYFKQNLLVNYVWHKYRMNFNFDEINVIASRISGKATTCQ